MSSSRKPRRHVVALAAAVAAVAVVGMVPSTCAVMADAGDVAAPLRSEEAVSIPFVEVDAGSDHALAVTADGELYAWGGNASGQLGDGTTQNRSLPTKVLLPDGDPVAEFSAGAQVSAVLTASGKVYTWGDPTVASGSVPAQVAMPAAVTGIDAGGKYFLAWGGGDLYSWGDNGSGRLGRLAASIDLTPKKVSAGGIGAIIGKHTVRSAAAGRFGGVAATTTALGAGSAVAWGSDHNSGSGSTLGGVPSGGFVQVEMGHNTKFGITASGEMYYSWNNGSFTKQTGLQGSKVLSAVASPASTYESQTFIVVTDTRLYAWFDNSSGQYGDGTISRQDTPRVIDLTRIGSPPVISASVGVGFALIFTDDGKFSGTGTNAVGQLGNGSFVSRLAYTVPRPYQVWP